MQSGKCRMGAVNQDVFCVIRYTENETVITCVNRSEIPQTVSLSENSFPEGPDGNDQLHIEGDYVSLSGEVIRVGSDFAVAPLSSLILTRKTN